MVSARRASAIQWGVSMNFIWEGSFLQAMPKGHERLDAVFPNAGVPLKGTGLVKLLCRGCEIVFANRLIGGASRAMDSKDVRKR